MDRFDISAPPCLSDTVVAPSDEVRRIEALKQCNILDTAPEAGFDDLTLLAAQICRAPISLITLVDESRHWFKSKLGFSPYEVPRDHGFCGHAISESGVFSVRDALEDERFSNNPFVTRYPKVRFYAGTPLFTNDGVAVGTLCVMGHLPRKLSKTQLLCLELLGRQASRLLGIRRKQNLGEKQSNHELPRSKGSFFSITRGPLLRRLRPALLRNELTLHFQPKICLGSGRVTGFEALVRWIHPRLGFVGPAEFVPMAESSGQIQPLTLWVLEQSLQRAQQNGWLDEKFQIAVNLSTQNLQDPRLPEKIRHLLDTSGFPAGSLMLEITESAVMSDFSRAVNVLNRLRDIGVFLSVDDYGKGYSSLAYLQEMPLHEIKIDRAFVTHAHRRERDCAIVRSTVELGHKLGMTVVAEGVEDISTLKTLREVGCDGAQGYAIGRPMWPEQIATWLQSRLA